MKQLRQWLLQKVVAAWTSLDGRCNDVAHNLIMDRSVCAYYTHDTYAGWVKEVLQKYPGWGLVLHHSFAQ